MRSLLWLRCVQLQDQPVFLSNNNTGPLHTFQIQGDTPCVHVNLPMLIISQFCKFQFLDHTRANLQQFKQIDEL